MRQYVVYVPQQKLSTDKDGNSQVDKTYNIGDPITQSEMDWSDAQWADAIRRGKVVPANTADDPRGFLFDSGSVGVASMQAEAAQINALTTAADPNNEFDLEVTREESAPHFQADMTPGVETELALQDEHGPAPLRTQNTSLLTGAQVATAGTSISKRDAQDDKSRRAATDSDDEEESTQTPTKVQASQAPTKAVPAKTTPKSS